MKANPVVAWMTITTILSQMAGGCGPNTQVQPASEEATGRAPLVVPTGYKLLPTEDITAGLGDTARSFTVSDDGEAHLEVPLWVPPGRAGVQPSLALVYGSRQGDGFMGMGWRLRGLSAIRRCAKSVAMDGVAEPVRFINSGPFCLDGARLVPTGTAGEFRLDGDPGTKVTVSTDFLGPRSFTVLSKDGRIHRYGMRSPGIGGIDARLEGERVTYATAAAVPPTDAVTRSVSTGQRYSWALAETRDRSGNYMVIRYETLLVQSPIGETHLEQLPFEIDYTGFDGVIPTGGNPGTIGRPNQGINGHASLGGVPTGQPNRKITFSYVDRTDKTFRFASGFKLASTKVLSTVAMFGPSLASIQYAGIGNVAPLRIYRLSYDTPSVTRRSLLKTIQECDAQATASLSFGVCRVPITFEWELGCGIWAHNSPAGTGCSWTTDANPSEFEDLPQGFSDIVKHSTNPAVFPYNPTLPNFWIIQTADINGDGLDDILYRRPVLDGGGGCPLGTDLTVDNTCVDKASGAYVCDPVITGLVFTKSEWWYALSNGHGFVSALPAGLPDSKTGGPIDDLRLVDLDSDGAAEVVVAVNADPDNGAGGSSRAYKFDGTIFQPIPLGPAENYGTWWSPADKSMFPRMQVADLNGDGLPDLIRSAVLVDPANPSQAALPFRWGFRPNILSGGTSLAFAATYAPLGASSGIDHEGFASDINNDGAVEFLARVADGLTAADGFSPQLFAFTSSLNGAVSRQATSIPALPLELSSQLLAPLGYQPEPSPILHYYSTYMIDVNGDGLPDTVAVRRTERVSFPDPNWPITILGFPNVGINTGSGFTPYVLSVQPRDAELPPDTRNGRYSDSAPLLLDFNLDGKQDLLITDDRSAFRGTVCRTDADCEPGTQCIGVLTNTCVRPRPTEAMVLQSTGYGFSPRQIGIPRADTSFRPEFGTYGTGFGNRLSRVLDVNGDGLQDVVQVVNGVLHLYVRKGKAPDVITRVVPGVESPEIKVSYDAIGANPGLHEPGTCTYPEKCLRKGVWVVSHFDVSTGMSAPGEAFNRYSYTYGGARMDLAGRGWLGFAKRTMTNESAAAIETTEFDNVTRTARPGGVGYEYPFLHRPVVSDFLGRKSNAPGARSIHRRTTGSLESRLDISGVVRFAYPHITKFSEEEGLFPPEATGILIRSGIVTRAFDAYGNLVGVSRTADVIANGTATGTHHSDVSATSFKNSSADWLVGLPTDIVELSTTPEGEVGFRKVRMGYDANGLLQSLDVEPDHSADQVTADSNDLYLGEWFGRDTFGLVTSVKRIGSGSLREDLVSYDTMDNTFPRRVTNAAGHVSEFLFHSGLGVPVATTDANGFQVTLKYDGFGRVRSAHGIDDADTVWSYKAAAYPGSLGSARRAVEVRTVQNSVSWLDPYVLTVFDSLGREVRRGSTQFNGAMAYRDMEYDRLGNLSRVSIPYFDSGMGLPTANYSVLAHDNLGRLTSYTRPGIAVPRTFAYDGLMRKSWDENGALTYVVSDALGREVKTASAKPAGGEIATTYAYGPFGTLRQVSDAYGNKTKAEFDVLGRRWKSVDPDSGVQLVAHSAFGEIKKMISGADEVRRYTYDAIGRVRTVQASEGIGTFTWDTAPNGIGELAEADAADGTAEAFSYDNGGRPSIQVWNIEGQSFGASKTYDNFGRLNSISYPTSGVLAQLSVAYVYRPNGWLERLTDTKLSPTTYWKAKSRDAAGRLTAEEFGNGALTRRTFSDAGLLRFIETTSAAGTAQKLAYDYDEKTSLLSHRHDRIAKTTEDFEYDEMSRLTKWTAYQDCSRSVTQYAYDDIGNLLAQTVMEGFGESLVHGYSGPSGGPHAVKTTSGGGVTTDYLYDSAGRQMYAGPRVVSKYSGFNLPLAMTQGSHDVMFLYDAFGRRVVKSDRTGTKTVYAGDLYERHSKGLAREHVFKLWAEGRIVAEMVIGESGGGFTPAITRYLAADNMGSVETVMDQTGAVVDRLKYAPFGARRFAGALAAPTTQKSEGVKSGFTGHEPDDELGLINMRGRVYDPGLGKFLTPDPVVNPWSSQGLNKYGYVLNNPLNRVDPSGFEDCSENNCTYDGEEFTAPTLPNPQGPPQPQDPPKGEEPGTVFNGVGMWGGGGVETSRTTDSADKNSFSVAGYYSGVATAVWEAASAEASRPNVSAIPGLESAFIGITVANLYLAGGASGIVDAFNPMTPVLPEAFLAEEALTRGNSSETGYHYGNALLGLAKTVIFAVGIVAGGRALLGVAGGGAVAEGVVNPNAIRFSQSSISRTFRGGGTLWETIEGLKSGAIAPGSIPPIRVLEHEGQMFTLDNRRLFVFQQAGMPIRTVPATFEEIEAEAWKFTTTNNGISINVRGGP